MRLISTAALMGAAGLVLAASTASAAVVCNDEGDCWRTERTYEPALKLHVYPNDWKWKEGEKYRWREPGRGHGYWKGGVWVEIK
jgi:hypothetical protein